MPEIVVVGVNHKIARLDVRERLAFGPERAADAARRLQACLAADTAGGPAGAAEVVILSTCNRTEIYACSAAEADSLEARLRSFLAAHGGLDAGAAGDLFYAYHNEAAARHLLRVAAGLDSLVVGENEIQGQTKDAYELAHAACTTGPVLAALYRHAAEAGKAVRSETDLARTPRSMARLVVELAREQLGDLTQRNVLVVGAGKMSGLAARALVEAGVSCVLVANRTHARAVQLAESIGGRVVRFDALREQLTWADAVVCSTCAPHLLLHRADVEAALPARSNRPLLVVDLAVPRDVDPAVAGLPGVLLIDIDGLAALVQTRDGLAEQVHRQAEDIVEARLCSFQAWLAARTSVPVIRALRARAQEICQAELKQTLRRLGDITPEQQRAVEQMGHAIIGKLLHEPTVRLKNPPCGAAAQYADLAQSLFGLGETS